MALFELITLKDSIEINQSIEKIWNFFENMTKNYISWHPEEHVKFERRKGEPHQIGTVIYAEEYIAGKLCKIKNTCTNIEKYKRIEYKTSFPLSIFHPKAEYLFTRSEKGCIFTAINYFKVPIIFNSKIKSLIAATEKHMKEEGENLKEIMENEKNNQ